MAPAIERIATLMGNILPTAIDFAAKAYGLWWREAINAISTVLSGTADFVDLLARGAKALGSTGFAQTLEGWRDAVLQSVTTVRVWGLASDETTEKLQTLTVALDGQKRIIDSTTKSVRRLAAQQSAGLDILNREAARIRQVTETVFERAAEERRLIEILRESGRITDLQAARRLGQINEEIRKTLDLGEANKREAKESGAAWEGAFDQALGALERFTQTGTFELETLKDLALDLLKQLAKGLDGGKSGGGFGFGSILSFFGLGGPSFTTGNVGGLQGTPFISNRFGTFTGLAGRQHGGPVKAGVPHLVGEAGPEIFVAPHNGRILSNSDSRAALAGGGQVTINYNVDARGAEVGAEQRIIAALRQVDSSIERRAVAAVRSAAKGGGPFAVTIGAR